MDAGGGAIDLHYTLVHSGDTNNLGPNTLDWTMTAYPIASAGGGFANADGISTFVGPEANTYTSPVGLYTYRITFLLDTVDLTQPVTFGGTWWDGSGGNNILINGNSTGNTGALNNGQQPSAFTIPEAFLVPGLNTLDFVTTNNATAVGGSYPESAVRVEMSGIGQALPAGPPSIVTNPKHTAIEDYEASVVSQSASFATVAKGRPPLTYQWYNGTTHLPTWSTAFNGNNDIKTNRILILLEPSAGDPTNFYCVVSNASGTATSSVATLNITEADVPPIAPSYTNEVYTNSSLTYDISVLFNACSSPVNNTPLTFTGLNTNLTLGLITQAGVTLVYTPPTNYTGQDSFTYTVTDPDSEATTGTNFINIVPVGIPVLSSVVLSGGDVC